MNEMQIGYKNFRTYHSAIVRIVQPLQQLYESRLAAAAGPDQGDALPARYQEGETAQHLHFATSRIAELYVLVLDFTICRL